MLSTRKSAGGLFVATVAAVWFGPGDLPEATAQDKPLAEQAAEILTRRCLSCHNAATRKKDVDLSARDAAVAVGAVVPGDPAASRMVKMIKAGKMPPAAELPETEIALLIKWVEQGAAYPRARLEWVDKTAGVPWSFSPVVKPAVPTGKFDAIARGPIDRFLFAELEKFGLTPAPPADRVALLRRVTVDLLGLPPTPEEVAAFLADRSADAYEKVVDRLLASPHYGERWARHWLDVVRFGESTGYEQNHLRPNAWPYRDYVIRAFNDDRPYDRFVAEQLAGDVLGRGDADLEAGTGFLVAGVHDTVANQTESGKRQQRADDLDDMVSTVGATFLGLTINCARCHDHKFDPIPQRDYYRLAAVFAGVRHEERTIAGVNLTDARRREMEQSIAKVRRLRGLAADLDAKARLAVLRSQGVDNPPRPAVHPARNVDDFPPATAKFIRMTITAVRGDVEPCLDEIEIYAPDGDDNLAAASVGAKATASSLLPGYAVHRIEHLNDGRFGNDYSWIADERGRGWVQIELPAPARVGRVVWSRDSAGEKPQFTDRMITGYRIELSQDGKTWTTVSTGDDRAAASEAIPAEALTAALSPEDNQRRAAARQEAGILASKASLNSRERKAYVGRMGAPDPVFVLRRGDVMQRGEQVPPGALSRIPGLSAELSSDGRPPPSESAARLALAGWITDPRNPLTYRVIVNRVWQRHFGRGLVGTPSDLGRNGEKPSHPALLDWLAADFVENGRRLKRLHKMIVTSYAYMQSSAAGPGPAVDAGNRLLWRMPLRRMEAEAVRDSILAVSGKLDRRMYGPGFALFKYKVVNVGIYEPLTEQGPTTWRRAIYQTSARAIQDNMLAAFDCPECAVRSPRREVTTTPQQAMSLLNGAFTVSQAGFFAARVRNEAGAKPEAQIERAFALALSRAPTEIERKAAMDLVGRHGLPALCRALFNANEFLYY